MSNKKTNKIYINSGIDKNTKDEKTIITKLKSLGKLDSDHFSDTKLLISFLNHKNKDVRYFSIINLAKLQDIKLLNVFCKNIYEEKLSKNRKEIASAIGRLRSEKAIPLLKNLLTDKDPNIILQAIRGLLVFKHKKSILEILQDLENHPNELVRKIVNVEFKNDKKIDDNHSDVNKNIKNYVIQGDTLKIMKKIDDNSVHLTFTSPPYYNAKDYSIYDNYDSYLKFLSKVFKEVLRITKEGRFLILNTSPIIIPRVGRKYASKRYPIPYDIHHYLVKMGWEFIDDIIWVKPEPSAKNRISGFNQHRKPLTYKPNCISESLMVYRKQSNKLIDWNLKQYSDEIINNSKVEDGYETSNVWFIDPTFNKSHSAVFPTQLCDRVIKYYSLKGDLVFDPFAGSGSVGYSAAENERNFLLTEINEEYFSLMKSRLGNNLFHEKVKFVTQNKFHKKQ